MYKLLVTTALVAMTATSASAWDGSENLIIQLEDTYKSTNLENGGTTGTDAFNVLQFEGGALSDFFGVVNKGVAHVTLKVETDNTITPVLTPGVALSDITDSAAVLVSTVQTDLFGAAGNPANPSFDDNSLTGSRPVEITPGGSAENTGLFGLKVDELVGHADALNTGLIDGTLASATIEADFLLEEDADEGTNAANTNVAGLFGSISDLNTGITAASGSGGFFSELNGFTGDVRELYTVEGFVPFAEGGTFNNGVDDFDSLSDWARGIVATP